VGVAGWHKPKRQAFKATQHIVETAFRFARKFDATYVPRQRL